MLLFAPDADLLEERDRRSAQPTPSARPRDNFSVRGAASLVLAFVVDLQYGKKSILWDLDLAHLLHPPFARLLFLQ